MLAIKEKDFTQQVLDYARLQDWLSYHTWRSIKSQPGFPDLVLIRPPRVIFAELKREEGKLSPYQQTYKNLLEKCPGIEYYLWKPSSWQEIEMVLKKGVKLFKPDVGS